MPGDNVFPDKPSCSITIDASSESGAPENSWRVTPFPAGSGQDVITKSCWEIFFGQIVTYNFCLDDGVDYVFEAYDDFGDGWGNATYEIENLDMNCVIAQGSPDNGTAGDGSAYSTAREPWTWRKMLFSVQRPLVVEDLRLLRARLPMSHLMMIA